MPQLRDILASRNEHRLSGRLNQPKDVSDEENLIRSRRHEMLPPQQQFHFDDPHSRRLETTFQNFARHRDSNRPPVPSTWNELEMPERKPDRRLYFPGKLFGRTTVSLPFQTFASPKHFEASHRIRTVEHKRASGAKNSRGET